MEKTEIESFLGLLECYLIGKYEVQKISSDVDQTLLDKYNSELRAIKDKIKANSLFSEII